jgi:hypothetical protein
VAIVGLDPLGLQRCELQVFGNALNREFFPHGFVGLIEGQRFFPECGDEHAVARIEFPGEGGLRVADLSPDRDDFAFAKFPDPMGCRQRGECFERAAISLMLRASREARLMAGERLKYNLSWFKCQCDRKIRECEF